MKTSLRFGRSAWTFLCVSCILFTLRGLLPAQTNSIPVVTIRATDPLASFSGDPGTFTVFRDGPTNYTLYVFYFIRGTATNGYDYGTIGSAVVIPAGITSNTITIWPTNHGQTTTKTVTLQLGYPPYYPPVNYTIGYPSNATVYIQPANSTNIPPTVRILTPTNGATFYTPVDVGICAGADDVDGYVATVEFFAGTNSLGIRTNNPYAVGPANPFCLTWSKVPPGDYLLTALATDNGGATAVSDPVKISVQPGPPPPPPTNLPPVIRIISPPSGAMFRAPVNIPIYAYAHDFDGTIASVEFFAGTNGLGFGHGLCVGIVYPTLICPTNIYLLVWSNAPLGTYTLTAKATDNGGASTVSQPVFVTILPPPPPPTNRPPVVTIIATDPLAIEGTNCWTWPGMTNPTPTWGAWPTAICRVFTNCGPKSATMLVHRFGATNDDLNVNYFIGGTATNGLDYVTLPGSVTILAGEHSALISIVPIDDGPPDITSTVVLKLAPSTNYIVGYPAAAAALILDGPFPLPATGILPDKCFHLNATGPNGAWFRVEYSTDLIGWTPICTNQVFNGSIDFIDPDSPSDAMRLYRAVPQNSPP